jgi:hypothetical protein
MKLNNWMKGFLGFLTAYLGSNILSFMNTLGDFEGPQWDLLYWSGGQIWLYVLLLVPAFIWIGNKGWKNIVGWSFVVIAVFLKFSMLFNLGKITGWW